MPRSLWWIKQDFRLHDNPALTAALDGDADVLPVFLFEPAVLGSPETSAFHVAAWAEALADVRTRLGGHVLAVHGDAVETLARLHATVPFEAIHSHEEIGTRVTFERDRAVAAWCAAAGVAWTEYRQTGVFRGGLDRDKRAKRWAAFMAEGVLPAPAARDLARVVVPDAARALEVTGEITPGAFGDALSDAQRALRQPVSETAAAETLASFLGKRGRGYAGGISSPNSAFEAGSRLSVHLAWGTTTGRAVYAATEVRQAEAKGMHPGDAAQWSKSLRSFKSRLHWRDHFTQRLETDPAMEFEPLNAAYADLPTPGDEHLAAWLAGQTGWPLVDACMRCVAQTGFLNFRMRAFVTSAAVHSLRMDWRTTLAPTARLWADYAPGIHVAQTQMQAGVVGINQLRVYSPDKQLADQDPDALFVKRWVPELDSATPEAIRAHTAGTPVPGYVAPAVDWAASSRAMQADYYAVKKRPETQALAEAVYQRHGSRLAPSARTWGPKKRLPNGPAPRGMSVPTGDVPVFAPRAGERRIVRPAGSGNEA